MTTYGFLSTYPPTRCGLATFTAALASAIPLPTDPDARVIRVDDLVPAGDAVAGSRTRIVGDLRPGRVDDRVAAAAELSRNDVVIVQHEYGIYGGSDGDEILDLIARVTAPSIVVLHTVRETPTAHQRWILERLVGIASAVVVMTYTAAGLLARHYGVAPGKVHVIPHGVEPQVSAAREARHPRGTRPLVLTWGLLGPGKGIEWGIRALVEPGAPHPRPRYLVAGQTHPKVLLDSGEAYRASLVDLARRLGVEDDVEFDGRYRDTAGLAVLIARADVVLLPYDSTEQTTSGVLAEAMAAGKSVVATRFPHAVEALGGGRGQLVDHRDPGQIAAALGVALARGGSAASHAADEPRASGWDAVGDLYRMLALDLLKERAA